MVEEERRDEEQAEGTAEQPEAEATQPEEPQAAEDATPPERESSDEPEAPAEEAEAPAEEAEAPGEEAEAPAEGEAEAEGEAPEGRRSELPPGAELEPIAIEPERELSAEERARLEAEAEERARREAEATAEGREEPVPAREPTVELPAEARIQATGKRKTSIARVVLRAGSGAFEINRRSLEEYFPRHQHQTFVRQPLLTSGYEGKVDVRVRVHGGGITGQAGAVRHGIARALTEIDGDLRGELKRRGLLTRDARAKERRKAGLKKARKRPQFSKR
jgi:small subunit ribosomal protein S9